MERADAVRLMEEKLKNKNLRKHVYAVEAVMKALGRRFGEDEDKWGLVGLLHDLDYEVTDETTHTLVTEEWLAGMDIPDDVINAIKAHADKAERNTLMEKGVYCADPITGFIVACVLIRPEKDFEGVNVEFTLKRMKEKRFAAGASRERMKSCSELGLSLNEFIQISINAMREISDVLGF